MTPYGMNRLLDSKPPISLPPPPLKTKSTEAFSNLIMAFLFSNNFDIVNLLTVIVKLLEVESMIQRLRPRLT